MIFHQVQHRNILDFFLDAATDMQHQLLAKGVLVGQQSSVCSLLSSATGRMA